MNKQYEEGVKTKMENNLMSVANIVILALLVPGRFGSGSFFFI